MNDIYPDIPPPPPLEIPEGMPSWVFHGLLRIKGALGYSGRVELRPDRKTSSYRVRVRAHKNNEGFKRRIAVPIPEDAIPAVKKLLGQWRSEYLAEVTAKQAKIDAEAARKRHEKLEAKEERAALRAMIGGTEWRRRRLLREWDSVNKLGLIQSTIWLATKQYARPNPKMGRKDKVAEAKRQALYEPVDVQKVVREKIEKRRIVLGLPDIQVQGKVLNEQQSEDIIVGCQAGA